MKLNPSHPTDSFSLFRSLPVAGLGVTLLWFAFFSCSLFTDKEDKKHTGLMRVELRCDGNQARMVKILNEDDVVIEEGGVILSPLPGMKVEKGAELDCDDFEDVAAGRLELLQKDGEWVGYSPDGKQIVAKVEFQKGRRIGLYHSYDLSGNLVFTVEHENGVLNGPYVEYFSDGRTWKKKGTYSNGKRTGRWVERTDASEGCVAGGEFKDDLQHGPWEECGVLRKSKDEAPIYYTKFSGGYRSSARSGASTLYHSNGNIYAKGNYEASSRCIESRIRQRADTNLELECLEGRGTFRQCIRVLSKPGRYFNALNEKITRPDKENRAENGPPADSCGHRSGIWVTHYEDGGVQSRGSYDPETGLRKGSWTEYYDSGEIMGSGARVHTRKGSWTTYKKNGQILSIPDMKDEFTFQGGAMYRGGVLQAKSLDGGLAIGGLVQYINEMDLLVVMYFMKSGRWELYQNGKLDAVGECVNGFRSGKWKIKKNGVLASHTYTFRERASCDTGEKQSRAKIQSALTQLRELNKKKDRGSLQDEAYEREVQDLKEKIEREL